MMDALTMHPASPQSIPVSETYITRVRYITSKKVSLNQCWILVTVQSGLTHCIYFNG